MSVLRRVRLVSILALCLVIAGLAITPTASADSYVPVSGAGSTWSQNAIDQWRRDVQQYGMRINYAGNGSSQGRRQFLDGTVDFAASDIPFQFNPEDGSPPENPAPGSYAYMPITAGGTVFMYNLTIGGQRVTNLRLSGDNISKIFTGVITNWNDPALAADNPGLSLPAKAIVPVVRSDGSGSTAQFSSWMISQHSDIWNAYCHRSGRAACGVTSYYPTVPGMISQAGDLGVAGYVSQSYADGAVGYVNYSYALNAGFPVVKVLNASGYYTEPTPDNVAVSLLKAQINTDASSQDYLTQKLDGVYADTDRRTYPLSSYSYLILPTVVQGQFSTAKGKTLGAFSYYAMCQGQQESASLGYSPMPINLVQASFDQIRKIPGVVVQNITIQDCHNPTFSPDGTNLLADNAPFPPDCDKIGPVQCTTGTGGAKNTPTANSGPSGGSNQQAAGGPGTGSNAASDAGSGASDSNSAQAADETSATVCDPDTGVCTSVNGSSGSGGSGGLARAFPQTLAATRGWGATQTLMLLAVLLTVGLVLAPGLTSRFLANRKPK
jgi:phosphate transport system substrate-binding protein